METQDKKKCTSCQTYAKKYWYMIVISLYVTFAAIYGTVEIFKELGNYFSH